MMTTKVIFALLVLAIPSLVCGQNDFNGAFERAEQELDNRVGDASNAFNEMDNERKYQENISPRGGLSIFDAGVPAIPSRPHIGAAPTLPDALRPLHVHLGPPPTNPNKVVILSTAAIIGIVVGGVVLNIVFWVLICHFCCGCFRKNVTEARSGPGYAQFR